ncbi:hypothetical protein TSAR_008263 [Trichomalopsis sarcophagae]|uniref:Amino acid transporter transmembrane domain-containing protein n=1 Tax=Trichomalopsis sarcophagae TaxID=543379 RepID=A0A232ET87_9HYME|nr:hypothetical protein TSAR_008263 [Trichomalopsis sarcophagae]
MREDIPLLLSRKDSGLSLLFATLCVVDIFGVFPIIALPRAIVQCGWLGIPLVFVVFGFQIYTASLLGKSWNIANVVDPSISRKNRYPLAAVTELTLGRGASKWVAILLDLTVFAGGVPNLLVASYNLQLFGLKVSQMQFDLSFCYWLLVVGVLLCPVMWLGSPRDMKWVVTISVCTVSATAVLIWWSIIHDQESMDYSPVPTSPSWDTFISGYGMLAFQFDVHPTIMTVQVDMKKPKDINKAVIFSFMISGTLFAVTTGLAVWRYGGNTSTNILQVMPPGILVQTAILISAVQLCLSSAIGHSALFQHLEDQLRVESSFSWKRCATRSAIVFLGVALGESVPRFDIVMSLIGGTLVGPLVFVLPPLMYSKARALCSASLRRSSAPEYLCSGPERRAGLGARELFADPRVHSRSTHFGFRYGDEDKNDGYSFTYYEDEDQVEVNPYTESVEYVSNDDSGARKKLSDGVDLSRSGSLPVMADASRPSVRPPRRQEALQNPNANRAGNFCTKQRMIDWFGYCVAFIGILITVSSTYINIRNTIRYVQFIPPCIVNATANIPGLG